MNRKPTHEILFYWIPYNELILVRIFSKYESEYISAKDFWNKELMDEWQDSFYRVSHGDIEVLGDL